MSGSQQVWVLLAQEQNASDGQRDAVIAGCGTLPAKKRGLPVCEALAKLTGDTSDVSTVDQLLFRAGAKTYDHELTILALDEVNEQEEIIAAFVSELFPSNLVLHVFSECARDIVASLNATMNDSCSATRFPR